MLDLIYNPFETLLLKQANELSIKNWKESVKAVKGLDWFIDLTDIFDDKPEVFFDVCHVYEKGNKVIAEKIYEHIKDEIR